MTTTTTDWRALCAELVDIATAHCNPDDDAVGYCAAVLSRARAALAQPEPNSSSLSDGYHTFAELYEHRHALCLALMRAMPQHWWFSWRHADGERCFGGDDWFIAGAKLPSGSSVTYHLPADLYSIAQATGATELKKGRRWDGHTPIDVVSRLREWAALAQPEPQGATDDRYQALIYAGYMADLALGLVGGQGLNGTVYPVHPDEFSDLAKKLRHAAEQYNNHILAMYRRLND
jgi:hypothetical protein